MTVLVHAVGAVRSETVEESSDSLIVELISFFGRPFFSRPNQPRMSPFAHRVARACHVCPRGGLGGSRSTMVSYFLVELACIRLIYGKSELTIGEFFL